ncbi:MAG: transketolase C-terminal domain-containing protein [Syntrophales bacterium]
MRNAFAQELTRLAKEDRRIVLLSGDIGNRLFDDYKDNCPDRFYNCGVAEANMTSMASGMAMCGLRPVTYTITSFNTLRCLEQIKIDIAYHHLPVIIVGVGSGLSYAELGATHHSCEDIAYLRALPNMQIIAPVDPREVRLALRAALQQDHPVYLRLGKKGEPAIHDQEPPFRIGKGIVLREGKDVCLLGTGTIMPVVLDAATELEKRGISSQVVDFHTIKPLDEPLLAQISAQVRLVVTVEEHNLAGGFGSAVAEWFCKGPSKRARLLCKGVPDQFFCMAGNQDYAREYFGLTPEGIADDIEKKMNEFQ